MTDQKPGETSPDEVKQKVALEVEVKTPPTIDGANSVTSIYAKTEVTKTSDAPDDWDD